MSTFALKEQRYTKGFLSVTQNAPCFTIGHAHVSQAPIQGTGFLDPLQDRQYRGQMLQNTYQLFVSDNKANLDLKILQCHVPFPSHTPR